MKGRNKLKVTNKTKRMLTCESFRHQPRYRIIIIGICKRDKSSLTHGDDCASGPSCFPLGHEVGMILMYPPRFSSPTGQDFNLAPLVANVAVIRPCSMRAYCTTCDASRGLDVWRALGIPFLGSRHQWISRDQHITRRKTTRDSNPLLAS